MNMNRAKEIYDSHGVINVTYNDRPIWIQYLQEDEKTAIIKEVESEVILEVSVLNLIES